MSENDSANRHAMVRSVSKIDPVELDWGTLVWMIGERQTPGAEQTFGVVTINPGKRNPLHVHLNCEELLYVLQGAAVHKVGNDMFHLRVGDVIRIPRGVEHWAEASGDEPLVAVISFSSPDRQTRNLEEPATEL